MCKKDNPNNKRLLATSVLQDCGVSDKFKILAYLCGQCITEVKGLFSPQPRKAPNVVRNTIAKR
jgi:hypothetical protein